MQLNETGTLIIQTLSAGGAVPIKDSLVIIRGGEEENRFVEISRLTDEDGLTERVTLPAPSRSLSLEPNAPEKSYSSYDVSISKDGFYDKEIKNIAIFSGIDAILPVTMLPFVPYAEGGLYPTGNVNAVSEENARLE